MNDPDTVCHLDDFGLLRFRGADARKFLQGQLSNDLSRLQAGALLRAGLHNAYGRTLALFWLVAAGSDEVLAMAPLELLPAMHTLLRRFVLRSRLSISDDSASYRIYGLWLPQGAARPAASFAYDPQDARRALLLLGANAPPPAAAMTRERWRALDIAAGLPQLYAATSGQFVAQMLNLDLVGAVAFDKGCYTGQEVIARSHYRGRVKRRLQRFASRSPVRLAAGDSGQFDDGRSFRVLEAVQRADGCCEFLAVTALPGAAHEAHETRVVHEAEEPAPPHAAGELAFTALPLPYALPQ